MSTSYFSQELYQRVFALTLALYRVTDLFPKGEILRNHLRAKADEIFEATIEYRHSLNARPDANQLLRKIKTIKGYLRIAHKMQYAHSVNMMVLDREYTALENVLQHELEMLLCESNKERENRNDKDRNVSFEKSPVESHSLGGMDFSNSLGVRTEKSLASPEINGQHANQSFFNERQKVILQKLKQVSYVRISDFYASFEQVSTKTIQRDLQNLVDKNILKKEGQKRWTVYSLLMPTSF